MNPAIPLPAALELPYSADALGFVGIPTRESARQLSPALRDLLRSLHEVLTQMVTRTVQATTPEDFRSIRKEIFPGYSASLVAIARLVPTVASAGVADWIVAESFSETEAEFRHKGAQAFGAGVRDQAIFTIWTLRKISTLLRRMVSGGETKLGSGRRTDRPTLKNRQCSTRSGPVSTSIA